MSTNDFSREKEIRLFQLAERVTKLEKELALLKESLKKRPRGRPRKTAA